MTPIAPSEEKSMKRWLEYRALLTARALVRWCRSSDRHELFNWSVDDAAQEIGELLEFYRGAQ